MQKSFPNKEYFPQLDGLRALAILSVFFFHAQPIPKISGQEKIIEILNKILATGWLGVDLFFVLSGFLITTLLLREKRVFNSISLRLFYIRRMLRIWPLYYVFLCVTCLILVPIFSKHLPFPIYHHFILTQFIPLFFFGGNFAFIKDQYASISLVSGYLKGPITWLNASIVPFWTLSIEEQFYGFWPLALSKVKQLKTLLMLVISLVFVSIVSRTIFYVISVHYSYLSILYSMNTICRLDPIMIGALIAIAWVHTPELLNRIPSRYLIVGSIVLAIPIYWWISEVPPNYWTAIPLLFVSAVEFGLLLILSLRESKLKNFLSHKALTSIGLVSFAMYVVHNPVLKVGTYVAQKYFHLPETPFNWMLIAGTCLLITYLIAKLSWIMFESKLLLLRHKYSRTANALASSEKVVSDSRELLQVQ